MKIKVCDQNDSGTLVLTKRIQLWEEDQKVDVA